MPAHRVVSQRQLEMLVTMMEEHKDSETRSVASAGPFGKLAVTRQWEGYASRLNAVSAGANKTAVRWKAYWSEQKYNAKKKAAAMRKYAMETGGGSLEGSLSKLDKRILYLIRKTAVSGDDSVRISVDDQDDITETPSSAPVSTQLLRDGSSRTLPSTGRLSTSLPISIVYSGSTRPSRPLAAAPPGAASGPPVTTPSVAPARKFISCVAPALLTAPTDVPTPPAAAHPPAAPPLSPIAAAAQRRTFESSIPSWALKIDEKRDAAEERKLAIQQEMTRALKDMSQSMKEISQSMKQNGDTILAVLTRIANALEKK